jgi:hypothetical protein
MANIDKELEELYALHIAADEMKQKFDEAFAQHFELIGSFHEIKAISNDSISLCERKAKAYFNPWFCQIGDELQTATSLYRRIK